MRSLILLLSTVLLSSSVYAQDIQTEKKLISYTHEGRAYPPVYFQTNIEDGSFKELLTSINAFDELNETAVGLPIGLLVRKDLRMKSDAKGISSILLSASTLGLVPVMSNKEFSVRYDIFLQGKSVANYSYEMTTGDVENLWSGAGAAGRQSLKPEEEIFMEHSINSFLNDLKADESVQAVFAEYDKYYRN
jgi:hypothetical protein